MFQNHKKLLIGIVAAGLCLIVGVAVAAFAMARAARPSPHEAARVEPPPPVEDPVDPDMGPGNEDTGIPVKTVRPKRDPGFKATVEQPAFVDAYYRDDLQARAAGPVKYLTVDKGSRVKKDQTLLVVDAPDVAQEVLQKAAIIKRREREKNLAEAGVRVAQAYQKAKDAWCDFKLREYKRFVELAKPPSPAVTGQIVDERWKDYLVAEAEKAEATEKIASARADVDLKEALIEVARADHARAQEILNLATIKAPFDGVITRRNINPGGFVHNASTTSVAEPLLRVERTDIVTIYTKLPDNYAPFVTADTEAVITMNGHVIRGKVTRKSDSLQTPEKDRTMRVEVDLYNGTKKEYEEFVKNEKATDYADLKDGYDGTSGAARLPAFPTISADVDRPLLMPGTYGTMQLVLRKFKNSLLLPSSAVVSVGGKPYVFIVKDGIAHRVPVAVQADNGKEAKVILQTHDGDQAVSKDFTGDEDVVVTNQGELSDGQKVNPTHTQW